MTTVTLHPDELDQQAPATCPGTVIVHLDATAECTEGAQCDLPRCCHDHEAYCDDLSCCSD